MGWFWKLGTDWAAHGWNQLALVRFGWLHGQWVDIATQQWVDIQLHPDNVLDPISTFGLGVGSLLGMEWYVADNLEEKTVISKKKL